MLPEIPRLEEVVGDIVHTPTGLALVDRALGGGVVPGQTILLVGPPGAGKTTLILLAAEQLAGDRGLYVTAEETLEQVRARFAGVGVGRIRAWQETDPLRIEELAHAWAREILIVDSVNRLHDPGLAAAPGTPSQIKSSAGILLRWAKTAGVPLVLVGHVTWADRFQGPRTLEHLVDTVLYYERVESLADDVRILHVAKNRFGPAVSVRIHVDELRP